MTERFIATAAGGEPQTFTRKGLAFAYARRKAGGAAASASVERQVREPGDPADAYTSLDLWTFHASGEIDHTRL